MWESCLFCLGGVEIVFERGENKELREHKTIEPLHEQQGLKTSFPLYKNKKNKTSFGKNSFGKNLGGGKKKHTNLIFKKN